MERSTDAGTRAALATAEAEGVTTVWDRFQAQEPQCGFGLLGLCCRHCLMGPCRIDPFGEGPKTGTCGASADTMVARGLGRAIAAGTASHSGHAKHLAHALYKSAHGQAPDYPVRDEVKLRSVASRLGVATEGKSTEELAAKVADLALAEFSERHTPLAWVETTLTKGRKDLYNRLGVMPYGIDSAIAEMMHRTTLGVDHDPVNITLGAVKNALCDYAGMHMGTDLSDILFGTPQPVATRANLGVLKEHAVNIAVHGHNPVLSDIVVQVAQEMDREAVAAGAREGINVVGICCTGNEVMMRHKIPLACNSIAQEMAIVTGAVDAIVADYQCVFPSLVEIAQHYHTKVITTMSIAKTPGATHVDFKEETARQNAQEIIRLAIEAFKNRDGRPVHIPKEISSALAGFSVEAIVGALSAVNKEDP
ncbi:MAG: carbon monoxide dehydrogenase, partial [Dehalococcoidia bacterium]|nr:carbon monoxide dehydrogenase [Dehalococcoidia bacterium]